MEKFKFIDLENNKDITLTKDEDGIWLEIESTDRYIIGMTIPDSQIKKLKEFINSYDCQRS